MNRMIAQPSRGIVAVRADATDPSKLVGEIKAAFEDFKKANDDRLAQIEAKGSADVVTNEKVEKINASITDLQAKLNEIATSQAAMQMSGSAAADEEAAAVMAFSRERGQDIPVEDYRAYKDGLNTYMRRGSSTPNDVKAALSVGSDPDGGYTVTPDMSGRIIKKVYETTPMRQLANVVTIGTDSLEGFTDRDEASAGWVSEKGARTETDTPGFGKWSIPTNEMYAEPKATQKILDDSMFDIEAWLAEKVADKFARVENAAFITGDGAEKPRGILDYDTVATADATRAWEKFEHINTGQSGAFAASDPGDKLVELVFALKASYRNNANWLMCRKTVADVRKLKDGDGNYLWQPDFTLRQGGLLLGYPVVEGEDMPVLAANSLSMAFGDFREAYTIVDRKGITVLRDPFTQKGFVKFYSTRRVGGGASDFEALKFLRFGS